MTGEPIAGAADLERALFLMESLTAEEAADALCAFGLDPQELAAEAMLYGVTAARARTCCRAHALAAAWMTGVEVGLRVANEIELRRMSQ